MDGWLAGLGREGLAEVLALRPDVLRPVPPRRLSELGERLEAPESVRLALARTPLPCLRLAEAVLVAERGGRALDGLVSEGFDRGPLIDELERRALVRRDDGRLLVSAGLREALPTPLGLGPALGGVLGRVTVAELTDLLGRLGATATGRKAVLVEAVSAVLIDPGRLARLLVRAPAGTRELLDDFVWRGPAHVIDELPASGYSRQGPMTPARWAREHGFIWSADWERTYVMPMEIGLALRGRDYRVDISVERPAIRTAPAPAELVAHEASVAALRLLDRAAALLECVAAQPLPELKGGGVGAKEVRRLSGLLSCTEDEVRLLLDVASGAGLLAADERVQPTGGYDAWLGLAAADRLAALVESWWRLAISPTRRYEGRPRTPLAPVGAGTPSSVIREVVYGLLPAGAAVPEPEDVVAAASWHLPLLQRASAREVVLAVLTESRMLGLVAAGTLTPLGLALREEREAGKALAGAVGPEAGKGLAGAVGPEAGRGVAEAAAGLVAVGRREALFGADMTAVVTGPPAGDLVQILDRAADREAGGVWRFGTSSVRRALDAGHTADELVAALSEVASGALPQPLTYLIQDVARRHGEVGVVAVGCCVVGDDEGLLAELAAYRKLARLRLRRLAPTVLASALGAGETLALLRDAGYAPVARDSDGTLAVTRPAPRRAPARPREEQAPAVRPQRVADWLIRSAGEEPPVFHGLRDVFARYATGLPARVRERVAMELQYFGTARITYDGEDVTVSGPEVHGGELDVWCHEHAEFRRLDLGKITKVLS